MHKNSVESPSLYSRSGLVGVELSQVSRQVHVPAGTHKECCYSEYTDEHN